MSKIDEMKSNLDAMNEVLQAGVNVQEILEEYILIHYDIPTTEEGDTIRNEFYSNARAIGAVQLSESVYFMPWTDEANTQAILLAGVEGATVFVHYSKSIDEEQGRAMAAVYDGAISKWMEDIRKRLDRIKKHALEGTPHIAMRMVRVTQEHINNLEGICERRGVEAFKDELVSIKTEFSDAITKVLIAEVYR